MNLQQASRLRTLVFAGLLVGTGAGCGSGTTGDGPEPGPPETATLDLRAWGEGCQYSRFSDVTPTPMSAGRLDVHAMRLSIVPSVNSFAEAKLIQASPAECQYLEEELISAGGDLATAEVRFDEPIASNASDLVAVYATSVPYGDDVDGPSIQLNVTLEIDFTTRPE
ncbi:MAG: hypothetical protein KC731_17040 [Myxococcales bacterium]|nr:hypothetical protein [Myxococcales bacterium]